MGREKGEKMKRLFGTMLLVAVSCAAATIVAPSDMSIIVFATGESTTLSIYSTRRDIAFFEIGIVTTEGLAESAIVYPGPGGSADYVQFSVRESRIQIVHVREFYVSSLAVSSASHEEPMNCTEAICTEYRHNKFQETTPDLMEA